MRARYGYHLVVSVEFDVVAERELEASAEDEPVAVVKSYTRCQHTFIP
jgi:hypothetical protein